MSISLCVCGAVPECLALLSYPEQYELKCPNCGRKVTSISYEKAVDKWNEMIRKEEEQIHKERRKITNQEYLSSLSPEEMCAKMAWLFFDYAMRFNSSRPAIIEWLKEEHHEDRKRNV